MKLFLQHHIEILSELVLNRIDFIIIGGYSVIFHGYIRTTSDLDIWLKPDNDNKLKFLKVLQKFISRKESIDNVRNLDFTEAVAFHFGKPPEKTDFITKMVGLNFNDAYSNSVLLHVDEFIVRVLSLKDLIVNKMMTQRLKDQADVDELQKIMNFKMKPRKKS